MIRFDDFPKFSTEHSLEINNIYIYIYTLRITIDLYLGIYNL